MIVRENLIENLENKNYTQVKAILKDMLVPDIAEFLEEIDNPLSMLKVFKLLPKDIGAEVFSYADSKIQEQLVTALSDKEVAYLIEDMFIDDAVDMVEELPANVVEKILKNSTPQTRNTINRFLCYKDDTAGSIMTTEFLDLKDDYTVQDALKRIRKIGRDVETINVLYVTDKSRVLKGVLAIKDILLADPQEKVVNLMQENVIFEKTSTDQESIAQTFKKYDILALPIVDNENRLVGIVTVDDVIQIMEEEATEDISKMAAVAPNDKPYLKTSVFKLWLNRVPWLALLMLSSTITSLIITKNETLLSQSAYGIVLTACIPMIMGTGGNAGGQASATIIRGIALDEISFKDTFKVIWKEIRVAILLGLTLAILCYFKLLYLDGIYKESNGYVVSAVICFAMFLTIAISKIVGCTLPLLAKKCHLDPAVMASPFITTIIDAVSLLILCGLSFALLPA